MDECCQNCAKRFSGEIADYSHGGCEHKPIKGFVCMAFEKERLAVVMYGVNKETGRCEAWEERHED